MKGMMEGQKKLNQRGRGQHVTRGGHQSRFMIKSDKQVNHSFYPIRQILVLHTVFKAVLQ